MGVDAVNRQHTGPGVENLEQVRGVVVDRFFCGGEVAHHFVDPVVDSGPAKLALIVPFDLWMEQFGRDPVGVLGPEPGPVEGLKGASHDLHVFLRHRLPPQPHGFEGPRLGGEDPVSNHFAVPHGGRVPELL
jgi:hypothetical protein